MLQHHLVFCQIPTSLSQIVYRISYNFLVFSYESLEIWQLGIAYAKRIYLVTNDFPKSEQFGLISQLRRAAISISANIAEGSGSTSVKEKLKYLDIAVKSALETTSEIQIAYELGFMGKIIRDKLYEDAEKIIRKIRSFKKSFNDSRLAINDNHL